jgi:type VI secretion system protein ImpJ
MPHYWGFRQLELDEAALALGKLVLLSGRGVFPDGTPFDFPNIDIPPLPLDVPADARNQRVFLAIPSRQASSRQAVLSGDAGRGLHRYDTAEIEAEDNTSDGTAPIQVGQLRMRLLLEKEANDAYSCLGAARLIERRADNQVELHRHYIPPMLNIRNDGVLHGFVQEVVGMLRQRGDELAVQVSQPGRGGVAEIADFLLLQTINRYQPLLIHLLTAPDFHPERLFSLLLQLGGDISTFRGERRPIDYPGYVHDDLELSFGELMADLRRSLSMILHRSAVPIELRDRKYGFRVAPMPGRELLRHGNLVLAVNAHLAPDTLRIRFPNQVKIGPVERIRDLVTLQLPGIGLRAMAVAPRQIPYHAGFNYFELERHGELWNELERSNGLAMHIAGDFPGLELEFWGVRD